MQIVLYSKLVLVMSDTVPKTFSTKLNNDASS